MQKRNLLYLNTMFPINIVFLFREISTLLELQFTSQLFDGDLESIR